MTKDDLIYLGIFLGTLIGLITGILFSIKILFNFCLVFLCLFIIHFTANFFFSKNFDQKKTIQILESLLDDNKSKNILTDEDYSAWDCFCDTPIIHDIQLNNIRVKCHQMTRNKDHRYFTLVDNTLTITEEGKDEIKKLLSGLKENK